MVHSSYLLLAALVPVVAAVGSWVWIKRWRLTPEERERRRRLAVNESGRLGPAMITDIDENVLHYSYEVRGVTYNASQDISGLLQLDTRAVQLLGPATVKYSLGNPADSIVLCETWSGLRQLREAFPNSQLKGSEDEAHR